MRKRIVIFCDGTWNTPDQTDAGEPCPSNVVKLARAVLPAAADGIPQVAFYDPGIGTGGGLDRWLGGAFGIGLTRNIVEAYRFLVDNYADGDEIWLFGFSRGAYTVRSTAGLLRKAGVLHKRHSARILDAVSLYRRRDPSPDVPPAARFREQYSREARIWFIGVWDTVGALGIPRSGARFFLPRRFDFHDLRLSTRVANAFHAIAIDERRSAFRPTLWEREETRHDQRLEQAWFAGAHTNIGGGYRDSGLSDLALLWLADKAQQCGLALDRGLLATARPDARGELCNSLTGMHWLGGKYIRPIGEAGAGRETVHPSALARWAADRRYRPENLMRYLQGKGGAGEAEALDPAAPE